MNSTLLHNIKETNIQNTFLQNSATIKIHNLMFRRKINNNIKPQHRINKPLKHRVHLAV